jgi:acetoin utilization deacetylase AcuC-like enzyme/acyl-CoA hydrolase/GNAT superfamily N-acetyltransferase
MKRFDATVEGWRRLVRPGARVFIGSGASVPRRLVDGMLGAADALKDVEIVHIHTLGPVPWVDERYAEVLRTNAFFLTPEVGEAVAAGRADYTPCSLSQVAGLFESTLAPVDVALISVSPPDARGKLSLGASVDVVRAAVDAARVVVAQVNGRMPRTGGGAVIDAAEIDWFVEADEPLPEFSAAVDSEAHDKIAGYLAELVDDGATLQVGIGATALAAVRGLRGHRHLGVHSGMFGDPLMELMRCGAVDNNRKGFMGGRAVATHALGSRALYDFLSDNAEVEFHPSAWVNDPRVIARNRRLVAINGARQIDLTGQVVRDATGHHFHGGIGAQIDFLRGAAASPGGRPVHVLPSVSVDGQASRIIVGPDDGSVVAAGRTDVHYVITEFGVANLHGKSIRERALEMIQIAHPEYREELMRGAHARGWVPKFVSVVPTGLRPGDTESGVDFRRLDLGAGDAAYFLRPLHLSDIRRLQDFFYSHSEETVRYRYGYARDSMPTDSAYRLVAVDQSADLALGIFEEGGAGDEPRLRAVGRFYQDPGVESAEVAFVVHEETRRLGMASVLFAELAEVAWRRGIRAFRAEVLADNAPMAKLFERYGGARERGEDGLVYRMEVGAVREVAAKRRKSRKRPARRSEKATTVGWHWSEAYLAHDPGPGAVETPERYRVLGEALGPAANEIGARPIPGRRATRRELLRCHAAHYLDLVHIDVEGLADTLRTGDTAICPQSEEVALAAAGAGLEAVDAVMDGQLRRAFVAVRPPGHHATAERGMGFCIFNNVALMARHAQEVHGCPRVLIIDWDVHHGNGTQDIFFADPSVFYLSVHQQGIYPFSGDADETGAGPGAGTNLNVPVPPGSGVAPFLEAIEERLGPEMEVFRPGLVLISAGFDSRIDDPLGDLTLGDEDFAALTRAVIGIADRWAGGRVVSVLEGGYNPPGLASAACAHLRALG